MPRESDKEHAKRILWIMGRFRYRTRYASSSVAVTVIVVERSDER